MSVATAVNYQDFKAQGLIPSLFADEFNVFYWPTTRMGQVTTGIFYDKLLSKGDEITVPNLPIFATLPYTKGQKMEVTVAESVPVVMKVNRARYFNIPVDKVDKKQSHLVIGPKYQAAASKQFTIDQETEFWLDIITKAHAANKGHTAGLKTGGIDLGTIDAPILFNKTTSTEVLTLMRTVLSEQSAVNGELWAMLSPFSAVQLVLGDLKAVYLTGDKVSPLRTGDIGRVSNMNVAESVLIPQAAGTAAAPVPIVVGNKDAISAIMQLNELRVVQHPDYMDDRFQGVFVYDWFVRKPEGLCVAWVKYAA